MAQDILDSEVARLVAFLFTLTGGVVSLAQIGAWFLARTKKLRGLSGRIQSRRWASRIFWFLNIAVYLLFLTAPCAFMALGFGLFYSAMISDLFGWNYELRTFFILAAIGFCPLFILPVKNHLLRLEFSDLVNHNRKAIYIASVSICLGTAFVTIHNWAGFGFLPFWFAVFVGWAVSSLPTSVWLVSKLESPRLAAGNLHA